MVRLQQIQKPPPTMIKLLECLLHLILYLPFLKNTSILSIDSQQGPHMISHLKPNLPEVHVELQGA